LVGFCGDFYTAHTEMHFQSGRIEFQLQIAMGLGDFFLKLRRYIREKERENGTRQFRKPR
jgi:hypothetical protein